MSKADIADSTLREQIPETRKQGSKKEKRKSQRNELGIRQTMKVM